MFRPVRQAKRVVVFMTVGLTLVVAAALAEPPREGRPLRLDPAAGPAPAEARDDAAPADAEKKAQDDGRAYYYSEGKRIYLNETGLAVAKLKAGVDPAKADLPFRPSRLDADSPLGELAGRLERAGLMIVSTEGPASLDLRKDAASPPANVDYVLPIVEPDPTGSGLAADSSSRLIFTPRIAVRFDATVPREQVAGYLEGTGLKVSQAQGSVPNGYVLELAEGQPTFSRLSRAANALYEKGHPTGKVLYAHPDFIPTKVRFDEVKGVSGPRAGDDPAPAPVEAIDPLFAKQWHLNNTGAFSGKPGADVRALGAWQTTKGSPEIVVAIIDDSVQKSHPDLKANYKSGRYYDGVNGTFTDDPSPKDGSQRHGTACAGVAVGVANSLGGRGIAPNCKLVGVNFWDATVAQTADAFYFANSQDAAVISCSWSWGAAFDAVSVAIKDLARTGRGGKGIVILFAAGNESSTVAQRQIFGRMPEVICVGASNWRDDHSKYSNTGPEVSVVAPSNDFQSSIPGSPSPLGILTTDNTDDMPRPAGATFSGYVVGNFTPDRGRGSFGGTSSATPLTAGVCALILSRNPQLTARQVRAILEDTADKIPGDTVTAQYINGHDLRYGHGRVNAHRAVAAVTPAGTPRDLAVGHFEITQGLQRDANDIPLVLGKPTVIRVFPRVVDGGAAVPGIGARLHAMRNGTELPGSPIPPDNATLSVDATVDRGNPNDSFNFTLNPDWYEQATGFWTELVLPASVTDPTPENNRFPVGTGAFNASYQDRRGLSIRYVQVHFTHPSWTGDRRPRPRVAEQATCDWVRALFPVDPDEMPYDPWFPREIDFGQGSSSGDLDGDALITELNTLYAVGPARPDRLYAWTPESAYSSNGLSDPLWAGGQGKVVFGNDTDGNAPPSTSRYRRTFAHELGHNTDANGLFHTDRRLQGDEFGYDVLNVDPFRRGVMRKYPSSDASPELDLFDVMRGGELEPHAWITPDHYVHIFNSLPPAVVDLADHSDSPNPAANGGPRRADRVANADADADDPAPAPAPEGDLLVVRGQVGRDDPNRADDGGGKFFPFYRIPATPENRRMVDQQPQQGSHQVRFLNEAGAVLHKIAWTPDFRDDDSDDSLATRPFTWYVLPIDGVKKVELLNGERVIDTMVVAQRGPVINNVRRELPRMVRAEADVPGSPNKPRVRLSWNVSRPFDAAEAARGDEEKLLHQIYYSNDEGKSWRLVATGLTEPSADLDVSSLPGGGPGLFQVRTTDGYNVTTRNSEAVALPDKPPTAEIVAPRSGNSYNEGAGVLLIGRGFDPEDGAVAGDQYQWRSDIQGDLGTGTKLVVRNLRPGTHQITLTVRDSKNNPGTSLPVEARVHTR